MKTDTLPLRLTGALLALLGIVPLAALIHWVPVVRWLPRAGVEWAISLPVTAALCFALARYAGEVSGGLLERVRRAILAPTPRDFAIYAGLFTLLGALFVAWYCYKLQPTAGDEMAQLFQARLLVAGRLSGVAEQPFEFFSGLQTATVDGRWFSQFPIGGPFLLAIGLLINASWLVNPLLAGWTTASVYRFAAKTSDEMTARVAAILFATSPFVLLMSGSQMNHPGALAFLMYGLVALADWDQATDPGALRSAALRIGFGFAASAAIRPYEAAVFAAIVGTFQLRRAWRSGNHAKSLIWQLAGGALPLAFLLYANARQTGHPLLFGYDALNGVEHRPGFHVDPTGADFTPLWGLHHVSAYLLLLNVSLFGGPIPSLVIVALALFVTESATRWDNLVVALMVSLLAAYACYWAESFFVGPRFLYAGVPFFVMIAARLPCALSARIRSPVAGRAARLALPAAVALAWILPSGIARYQGVWSMVAGARQSTLANVTDIEMEARQAGLEDALVIVHENWHGRIAARLRALGTPALRAESFLKVYDACGLEVGADMELRNGSAPGIATVQRVARYAFMQGDAKILAGTSGSTTLAFARPLNEYCAAEFQADRGPTAPFDPFLAHERFDREGRLAGRVVYVRDFGLDDHKLLARFGDRTWYRYRPRVGPDDHGPVFVPYYGR